MQQQPWFHHPTAATTAKYYPTYVKTRGAVWIRLLFINTATQSKHFLSWSWVGEREERLASEHTGNYCQLGLEDGDDKHYTLPNTLISIIYTTVNCNIRCRNISILGS